MVNHGKSFKSVSLPVLDEHTLLKWSMATFWGHFQKFQFSRFPKMFFGQFFSQSSARLTGMRIFSESAVFQSVWCYLFWLNHKLCSRFPTYHIVHFQMAVYLRPCLVFKLIRRPIRRLHASQSEKSDEKHKTSSWKPTLANLELGLSENSGTFQSFHSYV